MCAMPENGDTCGRLRAMPRSVQLVSHSVSGYVTRYAYKVGLPDCLCVVTSASCVSGTVFA